MKTIYTSKIWLFVAIVFSALISKAQNDLDATFGNNGSIFRTTVANSRKAHSGFSTILNSDNTLNFVERTPATTDFPNDNRVYVNKLNSTGTSINSYLVGGGQDDITHVFYDKFSNGEQILVTTRYGSGNIFGDKTTNLNKLSTNGIRVGGSEKIVYTQVNTTAKYLKYQALCGVIRDGGTSALIGGVLQERGTTTTWNGSQHVLNQPGPLGFISSIDQTTMDPFTSWGTGGGMLTISGIVSVSSITRAGSNYFFQAQTTVVGSNRLYKISNNGTIVNAFGGSGFISVPGGAFVADANGDIFITLGNTIKKYNGTSGALVTGWANTGIAATTVTGVVGSQGTKVLSIDNSGRLLMASRSGNATLALRYSTSGSIDPAFSGNGYGLFNNFLTIGVSQIFADANDDVYVTGTSIPTGHEGYRAIIYKFKSSIPIPVINISVSSLSAFTATYPNISSSQLFSVSGQFLGNSLTVTSSIPYEISANGSTYSNSLIFVPLLGSIPLSKVFVRLKAGSNAGVTNSFINCVSNGTPSKSVSLSATIAKSNLTVTAANVSRAYNTSNPVFIYVASGLINGDNVGVINGQVGFSTTAIQSSNVGAYTISPVITTVTAANYNIIAANGTLTITKINPTINITSANTGTQGNAIALAFNSNSPAAGTWSIVAGSGASLSGSTLNLTAAGFVRVRRSQVSGTNYNAGFFEQQVDIVGVSAPSIVCADVTTIPSAFPVNNLQLQYSSNSSGSIFFSVVSSTGNGMVINNSGLISGVASAGEGLIQISQNASAPFSAGIKFVKVVINKIKANEISVLSRNNSPFNLPDNNTFYSIDDFYTDEYANLVVSGPNGSARTYSVVSGSGYIAGTNNNWLYSTIPGVVRVRVTAPETNSVEALDVERDFVAYPLFATFGWNYTQKDVVYGNSALDISYTFKNPPTKFTFNNIISSTGTNLVSLIDNTLLGINKPGTVVIQGVSPAGGIYREANSTGTITIDIAKRALGATPQTIFREYGESNPTEVEYSYVNLLPGDEDKIISHPSPTFGTNASSIADTYTYGSDMFAFESDYYTATVSGSGSQQIRKAQLNIKVDNKEITYGQALPTFTYSITGFKLSQNSGVISGTPSLGVGSLSGVGIYRINITTSGLSATNYNFESETGTLIVNPATLTITGINATKSYGSANPTFTYSVSGFLNGDNASVITGTPIFSTSATTGSSSGAYTISINGESMSSINYNLVFVTGALTINKVSLTVSASSSSRAYRVSNPSFSASITGFVNGDNNSLVTGSASLTTAANTSSNAGTYTIVSAIGTLSAVNYNFSFTNGVLTVTKVSLNASPASTSRVYGNANPTFTANYTGFVNSENAAVLNGAPSITTTALQTSAVGTYPINFAIGTLNATNYTFNTSNAVLTITRANLTVTALNASKTFGDNNPAFGNTFTGFRNSDNASAISGTPNLSSTAIISSGAGTYPINVNVSGLSASNYNFIGINGILTINKANRNITITSPSSGRDGTVVTVTGLVSPSGTVSWSVINGTGSASVASNQLTLSSIGIVTVVGSIAADLNFNAVSVSQLFTITNLTVPSISFGSLSKTFTDAPFQLNATSNSPASLVYSVISSTPNGIVQVSPSGLVTILGAGIANLQVSQAATGGFAATTQSAQLTIGKKLVGIQYDISGLSGIVGSVLTFSGTPVAGNPTIIWSVVNVTGSASISGSNLVLLSQGTVELKATINEDANYQENMAYRVITISGLTVPSLSVSNVNKAFLEAPFNLTSNSNSTGLVSFSLLNITSTGLVQLTSNGSVTILGAGTVGYQAIQAPNGGFLGATTTGIISISKAIPAYTFNVSSSDTIGKIISITDLYPSAVYSISNGTGAAIVTNRTISLTGVGIVTIVGTVNETANYIAATFKREVNILATSSILGNNVTTPGNNTTTPGVDTTLTGTNTVTGISETIGNIDVSVYPNPASDQVSVETSPELVNVAVSVLDMKGNLAPLQKLYNGTQWVINTSDVSNGIYLVRISHYNGIIFKKLTVIK